MDRARHHDCLGTADLPIVFTSQYDATFGGDTFNNDDPDFFGSWKNLVVHSTGSASTFDHCLFHHGGDNDDQAVFICESSSPTITNCHFYDGRVGLELRGQSAPIVENNTFEQNSYAPIRMPWTLTPNFANNIFIDNNINGIELTQPASVAVGSYTLPATNLGALTQVPYVLYSSLTIPDSTTLTIEPGVIIKYTGDYAINVEGTLFAEGTAEQPLIFTNIRDDAYGGDTNTDGSATVPAAGLFYGIYVKAPSSNTSVISHCIFRYGGDNNGFVYCDGGSPTITNCHFFAGEKGIRIRNGGAPIVSNNVFEQHTEPPIEMPWNVSLDLASNSFINNEINGIELVRPTNSTLSILSPTGLPNVSYVMDNPGLLPNETLILQPGVVIKHMGGDDDNLINVNGKLIAEGVPEQPIVFTSLYDDEYGGDTNNDGNATTPASSQWKSINLLDTANDSSLFSNCLIRYGGYGAATHFLLQNQPHHQQLSFL